MKHSIIFLLLIGINGIKRNFLIITQVVIITISNIVVTISVKELCKKNDYRFGFSFKIVPIFK